MKILITGAAGMLGGKLALRLRHDGMIGKQPIDALTLVDTVEPVLAGNTAIAVNTCAADLSAAGIAQGLVANHPDIIFHLAAVVSGEAETDFDKGYRVNLDATRSLFDAVRAVHEHTGHTPRLVFASSIAVFGAPFPSRIGDDFVCTPLTSYGTQKAIGELLLADYTRRGFLDGIGLRLPTICIRPGRPNPAVSGFFSTILREPINGRPAVLPVSDDVRHWFASPRAAVEFLLRAALLDSAQIGARRTLTLPGLSATVAEQIDALQRVVGSTAVKLIARVPDPDIMRIVAGWPRDFDAARASELGFEPDASFDDIIRVYLEEERR